MCLDRGDSNSEGDGGDDGDGDDGDDGDDDDEGDDGVAVALMMDGQKGEDRGGRKRELVREGIDRVKILR